MRSDRIKISEMGVDIEYHLKYSRMVIAPEPKKGIKDIGMMGIGNTFVVTHQGGRCVNGHARGSCILSKRAAGLFNCRV
jgi:hypothetical protein